jgi:hypothetical protein
VVSLALAFPATGSGQDATVIPAAIRTILDQRHTGWRVAGVSPEVRIALGQKLGLTPNVVSGDFDGNGRVDYAMLVEYPDTDGPDTRFTHFVDAFAFLGNGAGFALIPLRDRRPGPNPDLFLTLQPRGTQGFDFEANARFV